MGNPLDGKGLINLTFLITTKVLKLDHLTLLLSVAILELDKTTVLKIRKKNINIREIYVKFILYCG